VNEFREILQNSWLTNEQNLVKKKIMFKQASIFLEKIDSFFRYDIEIKISFLTSFDANETLIQFFSYF